MIVVGFLAVLSGMAVLQLDAMRPSLQGDGAMRVVMGQLNMARETAVTRRHSVTVTFVAPNRLRVTNGTEVTDVGFESGMRYDQIDGVRDTPDEYGDDAPTWFGGSEQTTIRFSSEGALVDSSNTPINGTVFLAIPGKATSFRAVTVLGTTGRVRGYRWNGSIWERV
jgi:Tfp pilus assembly protein FimT